MRHAQARVDTVGLPIVPVLLRLPSVIFVTGLGRSTIYRLMADGGFPRPVRLAPRAVAWRREDIDEWTIARPVVAHERPGPTQS
jgi:prophage regulatory protein